MRISDWSSDVCSSDLKRNRLLNLKPSKTAIPLICPDPAALEDKLAEGKKISVLRLVKPAQEGESGRDLQLFQQNSGEDYVREFAQHALENNELVSERAQKELDRSEENTSELQPLMRNSYAVFCLKKKINITT